MSGAEAGAERDWEAWARRFESIDGPDAFAALFAPGGRFCDPVTPWTTDLLKVARDTDAIFPDWNQRVDRIRGGRDWAVFEWTGTGTFHAGEGKAGVPISMTGATVLDVDADGKVTAWRDYLDTNEPTQQIQKGMAAAGLDLIAIEATPVDLGWAKSTILRALGRKPSSSTGLS